ncbi:ABC transporter ATP-binding protein [Yoonia sp. R2331]|uniref:ABC transporter ATP-binding protein n=1 Tax=Yoonia sp. R2331 TaxID=3237238 RepID=UPI0034E5E95A
MSQPNLTIAGLCVERGAQRVLDDVSLSVAPGEILALLGPNGAGKSTLVSTIAGEIAPAAGTIALSDDSLIGRKPQHIRRVGVAAVPEGHRVLTTLSVEDNLHAAAAFLPRKAASEAYDHALNIFPELREKLSLPAGHLSGGQQQMLSLAQALMTKPKFVLADEMSFGLAPVIVRRLIPLLKRVADQGVGILLIEQYTAMALEIADRVAVLSRGRVIAEDGVARFRDDPDAIRNLYIDTEAA